MSFEMKIPPVGESISEVTLGQWLKEDGAYVEMDEPICELESEKATFELNAETAGILTHKASEGDTLKIDDVVCVIEAASKPEAKSQPEPKEIQKSKDSKTEKPSGEPKKTGKIIDVNVPVVGESINEVTISSWVKADGDFVKMDEVIAEIDSDKATFELTAEASGYLKIRTKEGETLEVGAVMASIEEVEGVPDALVDAEEPELKDESHLSVTSDISSYAAGHPSPAAMKILSEKGIPVEHVQGTGVGGRITKEDALKAEKMGVVSSAESKQETQSQPVSEERKQKREKMTTLRKTISRRLVSVKNETAMLTTFNEVDMKPIMDIRSKYKDTFKEKYDVGLGFMSFFTKACCLALQEWPSVNAMIDGDEIVYSDFCDVSIAVSAPKGLVVPVIRNAESLSFDQIEKEILRLATRARESKLSIDEMQGGTFTITNGGVFGSMMSTPIINAPQSAILGMHNIVERPMAINGEVVIRPMMYVALSYDHRIIDGRESVSFLVRVKQLLEDPTRLLLGV